ncbi:DUF6485 family protein [Oscillibacter valericigenes]|jgi:hypothetical protein|uniref:DUF6485 family protein n=1 Tax=Oscillibacter ruminantium TaxID=1263547 RepID=UPI00058FE061|nr:DUF6485 family protein [Oscillibacter ruminantium]MDN0032689.1 DUF6485 family protein [Oscillibacter valericigenes]
MEKRKHFCTCRDIECKLNPINHDQGCDLCVQKNLKQGEIPGCFFHLVKDDLSGIEDFSINGFVKLYLKELASKEGQP